MGGNYKGLYNVLMARPFREARVRNLGPIREAELSFGDLTLFVGPQATGKTILLETLKLSRDYKRVLENLLKYDHLSKASREEDFFEAYYGRGMGSVWGAQTMFAVNGKGFSVSLSNWKKGLRKKGKERVFYIPAQRTLAFSEEGFPKSFTAFSPRDPYVLKNFAHQVRQILDFGLGRKGLLFPHERRLKKALRRSIDNAIFRGAELKLVETPSGRRIVIKVGRSEVSFFSWSAGQREFVPLLLGLYWLMPSGRAPRKSDVEAVVIEEPEMGLHPEGVNVICSLILNLLLRGYQVIISTHSPQILETIWAIKEVSGCSNFKALLKELLGTGVGALESLRKVDIRIHYFKPGPEGVEVKDISSLDLFADDTDVSQWGGFLAFPSKANEVVSKCKR